MLSQVFVRLSYLWGKLHFAIYSVNAKKHINDFIVQSMFGKIGLNEHLILENEIYEAQR